MRCRLCPSPPPGAPPDTSTFDASALGGRGAGGRLSDPPQLVICQEDGLGKVAVEFETRSNTPSRRSCRGPGKAWGPPEIQDHEFPHRRGPACPPLSQTYCFTNVQRSSLGSPEL